MILESGTIYRSFAAQKDFVFYFNITNSNVSGYSSIGISGDSGKLNLFEFSSGKIFDINNKYIWSYNPREIINISGNISSGYLNYFINDRPVCIFTPVNNNFYKNFYFSTNNSVIDIDFFIKGQIPNYYFNFPVTVNLNQNITGFIYNNSDPKEKSFQIFTGDVFVTNVDYLLNTFPRDFISGNNSGTIILQPNLENLQSINEITESQLTLIFQTNFGEIFKNININIIPEPIYFTQIITGFTGALGFLNDFSFRKLYNYEIRSLYPVDRNFTISLENVSGHTGQKIFDEFLITGNATGKVNGFIYGFDYITGRVLGSGISIIPNYFGDFITGQIDVNYKTLRYATGNINYYYNLPLFGSGTGKSPEGTIIPASGIINSNNLSGFIFGRGLFSTPNIINLEGYYFNTLNTGQALFEIPDFNASYTGSWNINYENYFWKSTEVSGVGYTGYGDLIYPVRGFLNGNISNTNQNGVASLNSLIYGFDHTGNLLRQLIKQNNNLFINSGMASASENNNIAKNAFTGDNYLYITGTTGFIRYFFSGYNDLDKGSILYYSFDTDFNAQKYPYIFKLQITSSLNPEEINWTTIDTVIGANFYTSSPKIFTCKVPNISINNTGYRYVRLLIESGRNWLHKFSGNRSSPGLGIKNLELYKTLRVSAVGNGNIIPRDLVPTNISNYNFNGTPVPFKSLSGYVINSQDNPLNPAWYAFNNNKSLYPYAELIDNDVDEMFLGYAFSGQGVKLSGFAIEYENGFLPSIFEIEGSNNNQNYNLIFQRPFITLNMTGIIPSPTNQNFYKYIRFKFKNRVTCAITPPSNVDTNSFCYLQTVATDNFCCNGGWDSDCQSFYNACLALQSSSSSSSISSSSSSISSSSSSISSSSSCIDGKFQTAVAQSDRIYISDNYGQTWSPKEEIRAWQNVAISADGQIQTALGIDTQIYVSTDGGNTWNPKENARGWLSIAMTSNGQYQIATLTQGRLFITNNFGNNWYQIQSNRQWKSADISDNGYISAVALNQPIQVSNDFGLTWSEKLSPLIWKGIGLSRDGRYQTAVAQNSQIYISHDFGQTWSGKNSARDWTSIAINGNGSRQTAVDYGGKIYISFDYGMTWSPKDSDRGWIDVSLSYFADYQTALGDNTQIYVSESAGGGFLPKESARTWRGIAINKFPCGLTFSSSSSSIVIWPTDSSSSSSSLLTSSSSSSSDFFELDNLNNYYLWIDANNPGTVLTSSPTSLSSSSSVSSSSLVSSSSSYSFANNFWHAASMSADGKYQTIIANRGLVYTSNDYGSTWSSKINDKNRNWADVFVSSGGKFQIAVESSGSMFISDNFGSSWFETFIGSKKNWTSAALNSDAKVQIALVENDLIYVTNNSGQNWNTRTNLPLKWKKIDMSKDGLLSAVITDYGYIYNSTNSGNNWFNIFQDRERSWASISVNDNGQYQVAVESNGYMWFYSGDGWEAKFIDQYRQWRGISINGNGNIQTAVVQNGPIYISYNTGTSWTSNSLIKNWRDICISNDGKYQTAVASDTVYFSTNSGQSWTEGLNLSHTNPNTPDPTPETPEREAYILNFENIVHPNYLPIIFRENNKRWYMSGILTTTSTDTINGLRSARLWGVAGTELLMLDDTDYGIGNVSFKYRKYENDSAIPWKVEYSTNNGTVWNLIDEITPTNQTQTFSVNVNSNNNGRIRIKPGFDLNFRRRMVIDDLIISPFNSTLTPQIINSSGTYIFSNKNTSDSQYINFQWLPWPYVDPNCHSQRPPSNVPYTGNGRCIGCPKIITNPEYTNESRRFQYFGPTDWENFDVGSRIKGAKISIKYKISGSNFIRVVVGFQRFRMTNKDIELSAHWWEPTINTVFPREFANSSLYWDGLFNSNYNVFAYPTSPSTPSTFCAVFDSCAVANIDADITAYGPAPGIHPGNENGEASYVKYIAYAVKEDNSILDPEQLVDVKILIAGWGLPKGLLGFSKGASFLPDPQSINTARDISPLGSWNGVEEWSPSVFSLGWGEGLNIVSTTLSLAPNAGYLGAHLCGPGYSQPVGQPFISTTQPGSNNVLNPWATPADDNNWPYLNFDFFGGPKLPSMELPYFTAYERGKVISNLIPDKLGVIGNGNCEKIDFNLLGQALIKAIITIDDDVAIYPESIDGPPDEANTMLNPFGCLGRANSCSIIPDLCTLINGGKDFNAGVKLIDMRLREIFEVPEYYIVNNFGRNWSYYGAGCIHPQFYIGDSQIFPLRTGDGPRAYQHPYIEMRQFLNNLSVFNDIYNNFTGSFIGYNPCTGETFSTGECPENFVRTKIYNEFGCRKFECLPIIEINEFPSGRWRVKNVSGREYSTDPDVSFILDRVNLTSGNVFISGGCNRITGNFTYSGLNKSILFKNLTKLTNNTCPTNFIIAENNLLNTLNKITGLKHFIYPESTTTGLYLNSGSSSFISAEKWFPIDPVTFNPNLITWGGFDIDFAGLKSNLLKKSGVIYQTDNGWVNYYERLNNTSRAWAGVSMNRNGSRRVAILESGEIYRSLDNGLSWNPILNAGNRKWTSISMNKDNDNTFLNDGRYILASVNSGSLYVSSDGGEIWSPKESTRLWTDTAINKEGNVQAACASNGRIYVSTNYGSTWTARGLINNWSAIAINSNGNLQIATVYNGPIYRSINTGVTWTPVHFGKLWIDVAINSDGQYISALSKNGRITISSDSGISWKDVGVARNWSNIAMLENGLIQYATVNNDGIYVSPDYGLTWNRIPANF
jgi:photosystem II stability/assembly factor-like uncharacterized protein